MHRIGGGFLRECRITALKRLMQPGRERRFRLLRDILSADLQDESLWHERPVPRGRGLGQRFRTVELGQ